MAPEQPIASSEGLDEADLAKAFQELAKGERTATALEKQLNKMEERIEALLAQAERDQNQVERAGSNSSGMNAEEKKESKGS